MNIENKLKNVAETNVEIVYEAHFSAYFYCKTCGQEQNLPMVDNNCFIVNGCCDFCEHEGPTYYLEK